MVLDIRAAASIPGGAAAFDYSPDLSEILSESIIGIAGTPRAAGSVSNSADILTLEADVAATAQCVCARCLTKFEMPLDRHISVVLVNGEDSGQDDVGRYVIDGRRVCVDEIIATELILSADYRTLCREDCRGLCEMCGADLNEAQCDCVRPPDPSMAVLGQLLEE
jgi:uncharacterized protein